MRSPVVPSCVHGMPVGRMFSASYRPAEQAYPMDAGVRNAVPGATNAGHIKEGPVMQPELFPFPVSAAAQMRLTRLALRGAFDSMVDVMTDLRKLSDDGYGRIKQLGRDLVSELDREEQAHRGRVA